jgi:hypothetical protein
MRIDSILNMESYRGRYLLVIYCVCHAVTIHNNLLYVLRDMLPSRLTSVLLQFKRS